MSKESIQIHVNRINESWDTPMKNTAAFCYEIERGVRKKRMEERMEGGRERKRKGLWERDSECEGEPEKERESVCRRDKSREKERERERERVCVCVRERTGERERG